MGVKFLWEQCRGGSGVVRIVLLVSNEGEGTFDMFTSLLHSKLVVGWICGGWIVHDNASLPH